MIAADTLVAALERVGSDYLPATAEERATVLAAYHAFDGDITAEEGTVEIVRIIAGHINATYGLRDVASGQTVIIQRLNTIFDIAAIDHNLQLLERAQTAAAAILPDYWQTVSYLNVRDTGGKIFYDADGAGWRVMRYVPGDIRIFNNFAAVPAAIKDAVARSQGEAIAVFGAMLDAIPADQWRAPLPNFHNARYHLDYYDAVLRGETVRLSLSRDASRQAQAQPAMLRKYADRIAAMRAKVDQRRSLVSSLDALGAAVAHGDTKINNFIFRQGADGHLRCVCLIDLDTVQAGNPLDDLGDALRSAGNPVGEEPPCIDDVHIDAAIVRGITEGYLHRVTALAGAARARELAPCIRDAFKQYLYVQCLRFFTDGLVGNAYFKLKPGLPEDINLYRGEVQMRALEELERVGE